MLGVTFGTLFLGVPTAWLISQYQFFGKAFLHWGLLLPLAVPAYIIAYTYTGLLEFEGPVQSFLRVVFSTQTVNAWFPEIRSLGGAILMFSLVLYPYVYLLSRAAFSNHSQQALEASKTLGAGPIRRFFKVALPMARPAIIAGLTLVLMETLADFGAVQYFGVPTFTTGIYRTWTGFGDTTTTVHLSLILLVFVLILMLIEFWSRKQAMYFSTSTTNQTKYQSIRLKSWQSTTAFIFCLLPILFGFLLPAMQLLYWSITTAETGLNSEFFELIWNSFYLAFITSVVVLGFALFLAYAKRIHNRASTNYAIKIATLGYAIPGTVIAIAVMIPLGWLDNTIDAWMRDWFGFSTGLLLSGTLFALIFAYSFRFLSVALQTIDTGLSRIKPSMDESARTMGASRFNILKTVHLPLIQTSLLTAFILVFVEVLKELPTTLILRPFNFNTLAVRAYEMAADERLADAGLPALLIVLTSVIPIIILSKLIGRNHA
jgi:iron(III) transport system permease protein